MTVPADRQPKAEPAHLGSSSYLQFLLHQIEINSKIALAWVSVATAMSSTALCRTALFRAAQAPNPAAKQTGSAPSTASTACPTDRIEHRTAHDNPTRRQSVDGRGRSGSTHRQTHEHLSSAEIFDELIEILVAEDITAHAR